MPNVTGKLMNLSWSRSGRLPNGVSTLVAADQIWDVNLFEAFCTEFWHAVWAVDRLEPAIDVIQSTIEDEGRGGLIIMEPKAVSDTKEQDFAQLMAKAGQEHAEILGDDGEDV